MFIIVLFESNKMENICDSVASLEIAEDSNMEEEEEEENISIHDKVVFGTDKMIELTNSRTLTIYEFSCFFRENKRNMEQYFKIKTELLNSIFWIFSIYLQSVLNKKTYASFSPFVISKKKYAISHVFDFLSKLRELYFNIVIVDEVCIGMLEYSFSIYNYGMNTACILIHKNLFETMVTDLRNIPTQNKGTLNKIRMFISLIYQSEIIIKNYNFRLSNKTEQKRIFEGVEESNKKIRLL